MKNPANSAKMMGIIVYRCSIISLSSPQPDLILTFGAPHPTHLRLVTVIEDFDDLYPILSGIVGSY